MTVAPVSNIKDKYKEIDIQCESIVKNSEFESILRTLHQLKRSDLFITKNADKLKLYLHTVDINELNEIKKESQLQLMDQIIGEIQKIGSYGLKDGKRLFVGFNKERKVLDRKSKEEKRTRYFYTKDNQFSEINNILPEKFLNKIIIGDSQEVLSLLPDNCIDLIFTSPPYNFGLSYDKQNDESHWEEYFIKLFTVFSECIRVLKYSGRIIVNVQPLFSDYIPSHHIISNYFIKNKLIWKGEILWEKNNYNCKYTAWGSYKSPSSPYLKYTWEFLEIFAKGNLRKQGLKENIDITPDEFKNWVFAKWSIAPERNMNQFHHPAMFPEELARRVIKLFSYQDDIILDPFNGVGTTSLVAKKNQRRFLGIDISEDYCKIAEKRLKEILL